MSLLGDCDEGLKETNAAFFGMVQDFEVVSSRIPPQTASNIFMDGRDFIEFQKCLGFEDQSFVSPVNLKTLSSKRLNSLTNSNEESVQPHQARLLFVSEGKDLVQDHVLQGEQGELLAKMIRAMGVEEDRVLTLSIDGALESVRSRVEVVLPEVIVCLGERATRELLEGPQSFLELRGKFHPYSDRKSRLGESIAVLPTFSLQHLLVHSGDKKLAWEDLQKVMKRLL